jgi:hypothetical protein
MFLVGLIILQHLQSKKAYSFEGAKGKVVCKKLSSWQYRLFEGFESCVSCWLQKSVHSILTVPQPFPLGWEIRPPQHYPALMDIGHGQDRH